MSCASKPICESCFSGNQCDWRLLSAQKRLSTPVDVSRGDECHLPTCDSTVVSTVVSKVPIGEGIIPGTGRLLEAARNDPEVLWDHHLGLLFLTGD